MGKPLHPEYSVGDMVHLKAIGMPGIVRAILFGVEGFTYKVSYWNDGARKEEWCHSDELRAVRD